MNSHPKLSPLRPRYVHHRANAQEKRYLLLAGMDMSLNTVLVVSLIVSIVMVTILLFSTHENSEIVRTFLRAAHLAG